MELEKRIDNIIKIISSKIANQIRSRISNENCLDTGCSVKIFNKKIFCDFPSFKIFSRSELNHVSSTFDSNEAFIAY